MKPTPEAPYTLKSVQGLLGLTRHAILQLVQAGFVTPQRGARGEYRFSFQDVVLLRTASGLRQARIAPQKILRALRRVRQALPEAVPLTGLRIAASGRDVTVRDGTAHWNADTGQLLIDFHVESVHGEIALFPRAAQAEPPPDDDPQAWFDQAAAAEAEDPVAAEAAYRHALRLDPAFADAHLNLGALLCELGRCEEAVALYDEAVSRCPEVALLHFNRAIALEDQGRAADAVEAYRRCIALDSGFADAHYNLAGLLEQQGQAQAALRHYSTYRRLAEDGRGRG